MSPQSGQRSNAPFTPEQETWIILEFGALRNCLAEKKNVQIALLPCTEKSSFSQEILVS